jgi:hypothetical protein
VGAAVVSHAVWTLLVLLTACCPDDDTPKGDASLQFINWPGVTLENQIVYVSGEDGVPRATAQTDLAGRAVLRVTAGETLSAALRTDPRSVILIHIFGIEPGDNIVIAQPNSTRPAFGTIDVAVPGTFSGATSYALSAGCFTRTMTTAGVIAVELQSACADAEEKIDVVAQALAGDRLVAYSTALGVSAPGFDRVSDLTLAPWRTDFDRFQPTVITPVSNAMSMSASTIGSGRQHRLFARRATTMLDLNGTHLDIATPKGPWRMIDTIELAHFAGGRTRVVTARDSGSVAPIVSGADFLPFIRSATNFLAPGRTTPTLRFVVEGSLPEKAGVISSFLYNAGEVSIANVSFVRGGPTTLDMPELPDELALYRYSSASPGTTYVEAYAGGYFPDAKTFRERFFSLLDCGRDCPALPTGTSMSATIAP